MRGCIRSWEIQNREPTHSDPPIAVPKTLFLNLVTTLNGSGIDLGQIPSKIEGLVFGPDIKEGATTIHTLCIGNDNDFVQTVNDVNGNPIANPNQIFGFTDADLDFRIRAPKVFGLRFRLVSLFSLGADPACPCASSSKVLLDFAS
jgi:hypothetical protein